MNGNIMGRIRGIAASNRFTYHVILLAGSTAGGYVLTIISTPVLTRLYRPSGFGVLAVFSSVLSILLVISSFGYETAIPLPEDDADSSNLLVACMLMTSVFGLVVFVVAMLWGNPLLQIVHAKQIAPYVWLLPIGIIGAGIYQTLNYWFIRGQSFQDIARTKLSQSVMQVTSQTGLGWMRVAPGGLLVGLVLGKMSGVLFMIRRSYVSDRALLKRVSVRGMLKMLRMYRKFAILTSNASVLNSVGLQLPTVLLAAFYGPHVAGLFALGQRIVVTPVMVISQSVAQVFFGEAATLVRGSSDRFERLFFLTARRLFLIGVIPTSIFAVITPWTFGWAFGHRWIEAGIYARFLSIAVLGQFVAIPLMHTFDVLKRQDLSIIWAGTRLVVVVGTVITTKLLAMSPTVSIASYSVAMFVSYAFAFGITSYAVKHRGRRRLLLTEMVPQLHTDL